MREIKFRVWDKHKNMFIPTEVWAVVTTDFNAIGVMIKDWDNYKEGEYFYSNSQELSQFTGLRDRNGKEIYEGDIITGWTSAKEVVVFDNDNARFEPVWLQLWNNEYRDAKMEIIGNIYENPELLNITT